jgi:phosphoribosylaminoimidazole-succinocarboxamide synthase
MAGTTLRQTRFQLPGQTHFYPGKVRDTYRVGDYIVLIATDRISAFDHILPRTIPFKGQVLNQMAAYFLQATAEVAPNWWIASPDPNVSIGHYCEPIPIEMVIRGYLAGHAWRIYREGGRSICGVHLPEGLNENDPLPSPIITPTTKAASGHDEDITEADILRTGIVSPERWEEMTSRTYQLFRKGTQMAADKGLILVDTKYEFGLWRDQLLLMDEIHTPDSSRFFYADGYHEKQLSGSRQEQLSKEFVREWLIHHGFQGLENQEMPHMSEAFVHQISERYIQLFEKVTGTSFTPDVHPHPEKRIEDALHAWLEAHL